MSTLLSLVIVALAIGASLAIALSESDQPATLQRRRGGSPSTTRALDAHAPRGAKRAADRPHGRQRRPGQRERATCDDRQDGARQDWARQDGARQDGARQDWARQDWHFRVADRWVLSRPTSIWQRARSGVVLVMVVGVLGAVVAAAAAALIVLTALAFQQVIG